MSLSENHRRALQATLSYIDKLLADVESAASESRSVFSSLAQDLSAAERRSIVSQVAAIRSQMVRSSQALDLRPGTQTSASWAIQTILVSARIALLNAAPERLRSFGALDAQTAEEVGKTESELTALLKQLEGILPKATGGIGESG